MPTYEYECEKCGRRFEQVQKISDKPLISCLVCGGIVNRLISSGAGFILKGKGSYQTDYSNNMKPSCGRDNPCCGRDVPCENKPCE